MNWSSVWRVVRNDAGKLWIPEIFTILLVVFNGTIAGTLIRSLTEFKPSERPVQNFAIDLVLFAMVGTLGFVYSKEYFYYHRTDAFTKKTAFYRMLPIRTEEIVAGRFILLLGIMVLNSCFYYAPLFYVSNRIREDLHAFQLLELIFLWNGAGLFLSGFYLFMEMGFTGKMYLKSSLALMLLIVPIFVLLEWRGWHLIELSLRAVTGYGLWMALLVFGLGLWSFYLWGKLTARRLKYRDLH